MPAGTPLRDLIGSYEGVSANQTIEIAFKDGKVSLVVPGQPAYPLIENEKNKLRSPGLPEAYWIDVDRDAAGAVSGIALNQPEGRFSFKRLASSSSLISVDELLAKMIAANGGEENLRKHKSSLTTVAIDFENQGVQAEGTMSAKAPNLVASDIISPRSERRLVRSEFFDGNGGGETISFAPAETYSGKRLEDIKAALTSTTFSIGRPTTRQSPSSVSVKSATKTCTLSKRKREGHAGHRLRFDAVVSCCAATRSSSAKRQASSCRKHSRSVITARLTAS